MILKEVISYYVNNGSSVYCTLLDATKAFDRVKYCKFCRVLLDRKLPVACIRLRICTPGMLHGCHGMVSALIGF